MRALALCVFGLYVASAADVPNDTKTPADRVDYRKALNAKSSEERLAGLRQFVHQYPNSKLVDRANNKILDTLAADFPTRSAEIRKQVKLVLRKSKGDFAAYSYDSVAETLVSGHTELPLAESISKKSMRLFPEKRYMASMRKGYQQAKQQPPSDASLHASFLQTRAGFQATLGRIYVAEGRTSEGEGLLKEAFAADPTNSDAAGALGELAAGAGRTDEALQDLAAGRVAGTLNAKQQDLLRAVYGKAHGGSVEGLEQYLDERYAKIFPHPFEATPYKPSGNVAGRTVLVELFTGSGCGPCASADLATDGVLERYTRGEVAVMLDQQHIPLPDPLANPDSLKRASFYAIGGTPTLVVDGESHQGTGGERDSAKETFGKVNGFLDNELLVAPEAKLVIKAERDGDRVLCRVSAADIKASGKDLRLQIALVENRQRYSGENGIRFHPMVLRQLAGGPDGFKMDASKPQDVSYTFDVAKLSSDLKAYLEGFEKSNDRFGPITFIEKKHEVNAADLSVIAFLQDVESKHVLQAAYVRVN